MFGKKMTIGIDGMHCNNCAKRVATELKKIANVKSVKVILEDKKAIITYKDNLSLDEVQNLIESLGFSILGE